MKSSITRLVQDRGYTVNDMANLFGVCEKTWRIWANNPEQHMTVGRLRILATALNLSEWEILEVIKGRRVTKWNS